MDNGTDKGFKGMSARGHTDQTSRKAPSAVIPNSGPSSTGPRREGSPLREAKPGSGKQRPATCATCCYRSDAFTSACTNADSPYCADFVSADATCDAYAEERTVTVLGRPIRYPARLSRRLPTILRDAETLIRDTPSCLGLRYINDSLDSIMEMPEGGCE